MSEPIGVGDLVMVVRGHSCVMERLGGVPYRVKHIAPQRNGGWHCSRCGTWDIAPEELVGAGFEGVHVAGNGIPLGWLKKIPPLSELDDVKRDVEITA